MYKRVLFENRWLPYLLLAPQITIVFVFFYWPTGQALFWSFTLEPPFGGDAAWVGLRNFEDILASGEYWRAVRNTLIFAFFTTVISLALGLLFAIFADRGLRGLAIYKTGLIWPYAVAAPAAAVVWQYIFQPSVGYVGLLNLWFPGIWNPLLNGTHAMIMVIAVSCWLSITVNFVFFLAGLQAIPNTLVEAAALDGAGPVRRWFDLIFPLISPTFFLLVVLNVATSFTEGFGVINVMTQGGPGNATEILVYKIYRDGFLGLDFSSSSAQSVLLMGLVVLLTLSQFLLIERKVHYAGDDKGQRT